jgi:hypothetical protein
MEEIKQKKIKEIEENERNKKSGIKSKNDK